MIETVLIWVWFLAIVEGLGWIISGTYKWMLPKRWRNHSRALPYREDRYPSGDVSGKVYLPVVPPPGHRCQNKSPGVRRSIWICTCGRAYRNRNLRHTMRPQLIADRKFWWRIRPYHVRFYNNAYRLRKGKVHLTGGGFL